MKWLVAVLSFVGSTGSTTISFILPGLFYFKVRRRPKCGTFRLIFFFKKMFREDGERPRRKVWMALALAVYGSCILVFW